MKPKDTTGASAGHFDLDFPLQDNFHVNLNLLAGWIVYLEAGANDMTYTSKDSPTYDPADSKIRSILKGSLALHSPPPDGRRRLLRKARSLEAEARRSPNVFQIIFTFLQLPNRDPESLALSETFALSNARIFGLPGAQSLHMI